MGPALISIVQTRRPARARLGARMRCAWLRFLIRAAERDLNAHKTELADALSHLPAQIDLDQAHIDALALQLTRTEHNL